MFRMNVKKLLSVLIIFSMVIMLIPINRVFSAETDESYFGWDGNTIISANSALPADVVIPARATAIATSAFTSPYITYKLKSIVIPSTVTSIGTGAFSGCNNLTTVTMTDGVTSIGDKAFYNCSSLTSITIPNTVTSIGVSAFDGCTALANLTLPNTITSISNAAFQNCSSLTSVTIPNSVTSIGTSAFKACSSLATLSLPNGLTSIGDYGFKDCSSLATLKLPDTVSTLGMYAFSWCTGLTSITLSNTQTAISWHAFEHCGITGITIPSSVTLIDANAFSGCSSLTSVIIPDTVTSISNAVFGDCPSLTNITIGTGATSIATDILDNCPSLTEITVAAGNARYSSDNGVLLDKNKATVVKCPAAKEGTYTIPDTMTTIHDGAFLNCNKLTSVTIPNTVTTIGSSSFNGCTGLTSITLPSNLGSIGDSAFANCTGLTSVTIPASATDVSFNSFYGCSKLTEIKVDGANTIYSSIDGVVFSKSADKVIIFPGGKAGAYTVPDGVKYLGQDCFRNCDLITSITIPSTIISILGTEVFSECDGLKRILFKGKTNAEAAAFIKDNGLGYSFSPGLVWGDQGSPSAPPAKSQFFVLNNPGDSGDRITYTGAAGDIVSIYTDATGGSPIAVGVIEEGHTSISVYPSLGSAAGVIYVSLATGTTQESTTRTAIKFSDENGVGGEPTAATAPSASSFVIVNNLGDSDTITYTGSAGDTICIYNNLASGVPIKTATVATGDTTVVITLPLAASGGSVYATLTTSTTTESNRVKLDYSAEGGGNTPTPGTTTGSTTIVNNVGKSDTIKVTGLTVKDVVKVYRDVSTKTVLGTATATATEATVTIPQLGINAGTVYVTITNYGKPEGARTAVTYDAEPITIAPDAGNISVTNNATGKADTVKVTGIVAKDVVKVYKDATVTTALGTVTAAATEATVTISQLGVGAGSVYVTVTAPENRESSRVEKAFIAEPKSDALSEGAVTITNNAGIADTVKVAGLVAKDIVKVYRDSTKKSVLGTATIGATVTGNVYGTATITQLGTGAGSVYVTVKNADKLESDGIAVSYLAEVQTTAPSADNITIKNNVGKPDTVKVVGLNANDVVKVYNATTGVALGTAIVKSPATEATVTITQLGSNAGKINVTVTTPTQQESTKVEKSYDAEPVSDPLSESAITITNNAGIADTVKVAGLVAKDIVKVYRDSTKKSVLGTATIGATVTGSVYGTATITQLGTGAGSVYVTVKNADKLESDGITVPYVEEATTTEPDKNMIRVINNTGADVIFVYGLKEGDIVKVYKGAEPTTGEKPLGTAKVATKQTQALINIAQLGKDGGSVYITLTRISFKESSRVAMTVDPEQ